MPDPQKAEIRLLEKSSLPIIERTLFLFAHLLFHLFEDPKLENLIEESLSHATDMQAATSHVQSGEATEETTIGEDEEDPALKNEGPDGK